MTPGVVTYPCHTVSESKLARLLNLCVPEPNTGCWLWTGYVMANGYGKFSVSRSRCKLAHRESYELHIGPIPAGLTIDHLCRQRSCVNPAHLEPVTQAENTRRGTRGPNPQSQKTHCPQGHLFAGDNLYVFRGKRKCRACRADEYRRWSRRTLRDANRKRA